MDIGQKIRLLRKEKVLSQRELAERLNVHQTAVSQWEKGRTTPDNSIIPTIAEIFGKSIDYLYDIISEPNGMFPIYRTKEKIPNYLVFLDN